MRPIKAVIALLLASTAPGVAASSRRRRKTMMKGTASAPTHNTAERKLEDDCQSIVEIALGNPAFSTLVAALSAADLVDALSGDGPLTVNAPTNDAFAALPAGVLDSLLLPEKKQELTDILLYHVSGGEFPSSSLFNGQDIDTLLGEAVHVTVSGAGTKINDSNVIPPFDVFACNGVINVIDAVLIPPTPPKEDHAKCMFAISEASAIVQSGLSGPPQARCSSQRMASSLVASSASGCSKDQAKAFAPDPLCIEFEGLLPISAPVAENDSGSIITDGTSDVSVDIDVLANDIPGAGGEDLTLVITDITSQADPAVGVCTIIEDHFGNQIIRYDYIGISDFTGTDTCKYKVCYDERPDLCDIAEVEIHVADPDCDLSIAIECASGCDPDLVDDCIDDKIKENVANITLQFLGGDCSNSDNEQEESGKGKCEPQDSQENDDNGQDISMIDDSGLVDVPDEAYIVVSNKKGDLFERCVSKGDTFEVGNGFGSFESNTIVTIYKTEQKEEVLQVLQIHTSGSSPLCLGNRWGAIKLVGAFVDDTEKNIFDTYSLEVTLSTMGDLDITIPKEEFTLESTHPIDFGFTNGGDITVTKYADAVIPVPNVPRDLSMEQVYKYVAAATGNTGADKGGTCSATKTKEFTFPEPEPQPTAAPGPQTCGTH